MNGIKWTVIKPSTEVWSNEWIRILSTRVRLPTGIEADFYMLDAPDGVAVLAVDEENNAIMNRQFRPALDKVILELPGGLAERDEEPGRTAQRELAEETGLYAKDVRYLGSFFRNPARDTGSIQVYFARVGGLIPSNQEQYEYLETTRVPLNELITQVLNNEIQDMATIFAVMMLQNQLLQGSINL